MDQCIINWRHPWDQNINPYKDHNLWRKKPQSSYRWTPLGMDSIGVILENHPWTQIYPTYSRNHTRGHTPENTSENASMDSVMQFVVQNFKQINAMYSAFSSKRKEINPTSIIKNDDHPIMEPWQSDSEGQPKEAI
ncbi:hypothetical protein Tco_1172507 [Tanacetum coccineum]|uniref:Uncharacterized protein n=1 Tax=Tanacetum coccineum TaxID=301880 RepID=A0ABQ5CES4_9ASTR